MARNNWSPFLTQIWITLLGLCAVALAGLYCPPAAAGEVECMIWEPGPPDAIGGSDALSSGAFNLQLRVAPSTSTTDCASLKQAPVKTETSALEPKSSESAAESAAKSSKDRSGGWQAVTIRVE